MHALKGQDGVSCWPLSSKCVSRTRIPPTEWVSVKSGLARPLSSTMSENYSIELLIAINGLEDPNPLRHAPHSHDGSVYHSP